MSESNRKRTRMPQIRIETVALLWLFLGCSDVRIAPEEKLVFQYSEGVQSLHQPTYEDFFLACHPEWPERDLSARMAGYEKSRRSGKVTFSDDGVEIIKLAILGRGGYFKVGNVLREEHRLQFRTLVKPDYIAINYIDRSEFPSGAVLYLLGEPLGTVISLQPGKTPGPDRSILESVELAWLWTSNTLGKTNWCLESVAPIPSTANFRILKFNEAMSPDEETSRKKTPP
jgi:hypothetical protein